MTDTPDTPDTPLSVAAAAARADATRAAYDAIRAYADAYAAYITATRAAADQAIVADAIAAHGADAARLYREIEAAHYIEAQWCDSASDERRKLQLAESYGRIAALIEQQTTNQEQDQ